MISSTDSNLYLSALSEYKREIKLQREGNLTCARHTLFPFLHVE